MHARARSPPLLVCGPDGSFRAPRSLAKPSDEVRLLRSLCVSVSGVNFRRKKFCSTMFQLFVGRMAKIFPKVLTPRDSNNRLRRGTAKGPGLPLGCLTCEKPLGFREGCWSAAMRDSRVSSLGCLPVRLGTKPLISGGTVPCEGSASRPELAEDALALQVPKTWLGRCSRR